ncbi:hypothetical protein L3X38_038677 [Prunus dulcis]|uniref:F-box domain-containing protein n=1 Tax=Prunus dulcis TaxID=3755 RepID=A0AAD4YRU8_PRUDU|nr:hypothetical protein L3X38_038677 [Prunus dulcis]
MARASCKGEGGCSESSESMIEIDRLSNLPDQVSHHILSFLTIKHLAPFCCVSKKCRELSLSSPSLDFDEFTTVRPSSCAKRHRLLNDLDSHDEEDSEETPCFCKDEYFRIMSWVHNALRCNVEVLDLDFNDNQEWTPKFPSSIFLCVVVLFFLQSHIKTKPPLNDPESNTFGFDMQYWKM